MISTKAFKTMKCYSVQPSGPIVIEPTVFRDVRGRFLETYQRDRYVASGIMDEFVQDNASLSVRGTLRGLHFQNPYPQAKLVYVLHGSVFDVAVDVRFDSATFRSWIGAHLSDVNHHQLYVPAGYAHGFCVLSESAIVAYKCTRTYVPDADMCVRWDDPDIGIAWPVRSPILSEKDRDAPRLNELSQEALTFAGVVAVEY